MKHSLIALAIVALLLAPALAKPKTKACDPQQGWVELTDTDPMIPTLEATAEVQGKKIAADTAGCIYRQTIVQKMCQDPAVLTYQYGGKVQMRCTEVAKPGKPGKPGKPEKFKNVMVDFIGGYPVAL